MNTPDDINTPHPAQAEIGDSVRAELARIVASAEFANSPRLQQFLTYVVDQALAGGAANIRAKTIAMDVYNYDVSQLNEREAVVRVDAGRVRRKLEQFYSQEGADSRVKISLPIGSYAPDFQPIEPVEDTVSDDHPKNRPVVIWGGVAIGAILLAGVVVWVIRDPAPRDAATVPYYDLSPARLEATNLAQNGRQLMFPAFGLTRLNAALQVFQAAVAADPVYPGGYAGSAQAEATMALLAQSPAQAEDLLRQADQNSTRALTLAPDEAWPLIARAWYDFVAGDLQKADELSARAVDLAPLDPHVAEFYGLIALYSGRFDDILSRVDDYDQMARNDPGFVFGNVLGAAQFHTGKYDAAIATFDRYINRGGPFGPIAMGYIMAAHAKNGDISTAADLADRFNTTWPDVPLQAIKLRLFVDDRHAETLFDAMRQAGWREGAAPIAD